MSNMKNGFFTISRWHGKKNKDKSAAAPGSLSTNLNMSMPALDMHNTSQLEHNRISLLPVATSNAPFEQTFRITVLLPRDQLYVARLGAHVPLSKLLELVCDNKQLSKDKYEFKNTVDPSQIYDCNLTIGELGLSEIRLCYKSDSNDNYHSEDAVKIHRTSVIRDSLYSSKSSGSENCARTTLHPPLAQPKVARKKRVAPRPLTQVFTSECPAPVESESNKLNQPIESLQSAALQSRSLAHCASTPNLTSTYERISSNIDYTDYSNVGETNSYVKNNAPTVNGNAVPSDNEGVSMLVLQNNEHNLLSGSEQSLSVTATSGTILDDQSQNSLPKPPPRRRLVQMKKKTAPVPPPRGSIYMEDSISTSSREATPVMAPAVVPSQSTEPQTSKTITTSTTTTESNTAMHRPLTLDLTPTSINRTEEIKYMDSEISPTLRLHKLTAPEPMTSVKSMPETVGDNEIPPSAITPDIASVTTTIAATELASAPKPLPRVTTKTLLNTTSDVLTITKPTTNSTTIIAVTTTPTGNRVPSVSPEPYSLSSDPSSIGHDLGIINPGATDSDNFSNQGDLEIGMPTSSATSNSQLLEHSMHDCKSTIESSSDEDEMIKVYNFKLGKTLIQLTSTEEENTSNINSNNAEIATSTNGLTATNLDIGTATSSTQIASVVPKTSPSSYSIPISTLPKSTDTRSMSKTEAKETADTANTSIITEHPVLMVETSTTTIIKENLADEVSRTELELSIATPATTKQSAKSEPASPSTPVPSSQTPRTDFTNELNMMVNKQRLDTLFKESGETTPPPEIEAVRPNTLPNFSISAITIQPQPRSLSPMSPKSTKLSLPDENSNTKSQMPFESLTDNNSSYRTAARQVRDNGTDPDTIQSNGPNLRCYSQISLKLSDPRSSNLIANIEEPRPQQSSEVVKTILTSRKESLANAKDDIEQNEKLQIKISDEIMAQNVTELPNPNNINYVTISENSNSKKEISTQTTKESTKIYRYSGPPNLNFATWNERSRTQVSIKNDGDYIIGGKNADMQKTAATNISETQHFNSSSTSHIIISNPKANVSNTIISRMGIPEREVQVPITVKKAPRKSVMETPGNIEVVSVNEGIKDRTDMNRKAAVPTQKTGLRDTLPRTNETYRVSTPTYTTPTMEQHRVSVSPLISILPFSQNTLRKTGLKEKILANDEPEQLTVSRVVVETSTSTKPKQRFSQIQSSTYTTAPPMSTTKTVNHNNTQSFSTNSKVYTTHITAAPPELNNNNKISLQNTEVITSLNKTLITPVQKSAPSRSPISKTSESNITYRSLPTLRSESVTIYPPQAPALPKNTVFLRSTSLKPTATSSNGSAGDTRDQLLEAIRNFNRDALKSDHVPKTKYTKRNI